MKLPMILMATVITGCSNTQPTPPQAPVDGPKPNLVDRTYSYSYRHDERGGAAELQDTWYHSLNTPLAVEEKIELLTPLSLYEYQRWERYCSGAKSMTLADWEYVDSQGDELMPAGLKQDCSSPTFNYEQFKTAWFAYCKTDDKLDNKQREIVKASNPLFKDCKD